MSTSRNNLLPQKLTTKHMKNALLSIDRNTNYEYASSNSICNILRALYLLRRCNSVPSPVEMRSKHSVISMQFIPKKSETKQFEQTARQKYKTSMYMNITAIVREYVPRKLNT